MQLPLRQEAIHQGDEPNVVRRLQQMNQLVNDKIFQTLARLLGEVGVQSDCVGAVIAATPLGFHALHKKPMNLHSQQWLPFCNHYWGGILDLLAIPFF